MLEIAGAKPKQSRVLINLKSNIKIQLSGKTPRQRLNILKINDKSRRERSTREERVGLNVFRERYEGMKWSKSRLCFEKDKLTSKLNGADVGGTNNSREFAKKTDDNSSNRPHYELESDAASLNIQ